MRWTNVYTMFQTGMSFSNMNTAYALFMTTTLEVFFMNAQQAVVAALRHKTIIPAFNIPYLPMVEPVVQAIIYENSVAMVQVARLEWEKFESQSPEAVAKEYRRESCAGLLCADRNADAQRNARRQ